MAIPSDGGNPQGGSGTRNDDDPFVPADPPQDLDTGQQSTNSKVWTTGQGVTTIDTSKWVYWPRNTPEYVDAVTRQRNPGGLNWYAFNRATTQEYANLSWNDLSFEQQQQIDALAKARGTGNSTGKALWETAVAMAERDYREGRESTPLDYLNSWVGQYTDGGMGSGSGGGGGYSGPVATTTLMDDRDVDRTANALALELIGRPLSDKELAKVTARLRTEERANPTITTPGTGTSLTQSGLSAEGRADVLREVIAENPEYRQFQVDNTVLDTMLSELNKREQMVNG